jgi:hypothetical protein
VTAAAFAALVVVACLAITGRAEPAPGDAVALLPLDADKTLEIYGQPVASELARALVTGNVQVVVVGPKMAVPERARLIIDGTIALGKANAVTIALRIRNRVDGVVLETLSATAPGLAKIDGAAAELSAQILPLVRDRLAQAHRPAPGGDRARPVETRSSPGPDKLVLVAISDDRRGPDSALFTRAFHVALTEWTRAHHRRLQKIEPGTLALKLASRTVSASGTDLALGFRILDYAPEPGTPPMARARVRVQITDPRHVVFDRVVVTDTVVGDTSRGPQDLAARVAREVLDIIRPHLRRGVPSW